MSTNTEDVKISLTAEDNASRQIKEVRRELERLKASLSGLASNPISPSFAANTLRANARDAMRPSAASAAVAAAERQVAAQRRADARAAHRDQMGFDREALRRLHDRLDLGRRILDQDLAGIRTLDRASAAADTASRGRARSRRTEEAAAARATVAGLREIGRARRAAEEQAEHHQAASRPTSPLPPAPQRDQTVPRTVLRPPTSFSAPEDARKIVQQITGRPRAAVAPATSNTEGHRPEQPLDRHLAPDLDRSAVAGLRARMGLHTRMTRQRVREEAEIERTRRVTESAALADFRARFAFGSRMTRQRVDEERTVERERARSALAAEREAARAHRAEMQRQAAQARALVRDRRDGVRHGRDAYRNGRDAVRDLVRPAGTAGLVGAGAAGLAGRRVLRAEADVDSAEISARQFAGLSQAEARRLRDGWAAPLAEALGTGADRLLNSYVEAIKTGIPVEGAKHFAELNTKVAEAWDVPFQNVTDILGTVNTILTSDGSKFSSERLTSVANTMQHLSAKQSTTPEKLMAFLKHGAGGAQLLGMSQEAGLAFGSASTSLGNLAGESGSLLDYIAGRIVELPRLTRKQGDEGRQARDLVASLGLGSADALDAERRAAPDDFLPKFLDRFSQIKDQKKQEEAIRFFTGREWLGEFGRMVKGIDTYREAVKLSKEAKGLDAIGAVWDLHKTKLAFVFKQFKAGWLNILGEFGKELSPLAREAGDYFLSWSSQLRNGGLAQRFRAAIQGFIEGLGFKNFKDLLHGVFGTPGEGSAGSIKAWGDAARGFAAGLRDVGQTLAAFFRLFAGKDASPEAMGRLAGQILGFGAVLMIASPAFALLGAVGTGILAVATAALSAHKLLSGLGLIKPPATPSASGVGAGAAGAPAGATVAPGAASAAGSGVLTRLLSVFGRTLPAIVAGSSSLSKQDQDALLAKLARIAKEREGAKAKGAPTAGPADLGPEYRALLDALAVMNAGPPLKPEAPATAPSATTGGADAAKPAPDDALGRLFRELLRDPERDPRKVGRHEPETPAAREFVSRIEGFDRRNLFALSGLTLALDRTGTRLLNLTAAFDQAAQRRRIPAITQVSPWTPSNGLPADLGQAAQEFGPRFHRPRHLQVPAWFGRGAGGNGAGGGSASGMPDPGTGAGSGPYKGLLDHIARAEGTAGRAGGGYNTSLDYGRWLPGGQEQNLTGLTLEEVDKLQTEMLANPENRAQHGHGLGSSALGRYQIVRKTLRGLRERLGLRGDQVFDEALQDRLGAELIRGRGADPNGLANEWASLRGRKLDTAVDLARQIPRNAQTTPGPRGAAEGAGEGAAGAVDVARQFEGLHEVRDNATLRRFMGREVAGDLNAWCGAFVNAALRSVGLKGTGSDIANSFLRWGRAVDPGDVQKGDVAVEHRGRGADATGGHVGMATGEKRMNPRTGRLEVEVISGNSSDRVRTEWEDAAKLAIRRSTDPLAAARQVPQALRDVQRAPGAPAELGESPRNSFGGTDPLRRGRAPEGGPDAPGLARSVSLPPPRPTAADLAAGVPQPPQRPRGLEDQAPAGGLRAGGAPAGQPISVVIHAGNQSPSEMASALQRRLSEERSFRGFDTDPGYA